MMRPQTCRDLPHIAAWLAYVEQCHPQVISLDLERVRQVLQVLHLDWGSTTLIVVAGTNGKGSSCAMLESIYRHAGYRTALYTSPHLLRFEERLRIQGQEVFADALLPHFEAVERARFQNRGDTPVELTYFEFTTLALLRAISQATPAIDVAVLEVGLGGRLDAVNGVDGHAMLITSIDVDHQEFLGPTREEIGREKAGIARCGRPCIVSDPMPPQSMLDVLHTLGADVWLQGRDWFVEGDRQQWSCTIQGHTLAGLAYPTLRGANQLLNASGVLATIQALRHQRPVFAQAIRQGLAQTVWPCRFQVLPGQPVVVLDVAHNPQAVAVLMANLDAMGYFSCTRAVFGALSDKDVSAMLAYCDGLVDHWYFTDLSGPRGQLASHHAKEWYHYLESKSAGSVPTSTSMSVMPVPVGLYPTPEAAFAQAQADSASGDRIVVFGSFHTVTPVWAKTCGPRSDTLATA